MQEVGGINLATQEGESQPFFISVNLPIELRQALPGLLHEFKDVLAWTYA